MATRWYFARDGAKLGPFSVAQLKELAASRQLRPQDTVWKEGVERGVPAARVEHLFPDSPAKPPPATGGGEEAPVPPTPAVAAAVLPSPSPAALTPLAARLAMPEDLEFAAGETAWEASVSTVPVGGQGGELPSTATQSVDSPSGQNPPPGGHEGGPPQQQVRKRRVLGVKGGVIMSQDGVVLRYRKKCLRCGYADTSLATVPIRSGVTRGTFFCPKCKKSQQVEIQGVN